jgi:NADP-dependent 3-hydroxy acid dehydrogenase YdfG
VIGETIGRMEADRKTMLITGAGSGIGAATARLLATEWNLVLCGRRPGPVEELAAALGGEDRAVAIGCDVSEWDQVEAMVGRGLEAFGRIDAVFANAGFGASRGFLEETPEHWRAMVLTNVLGPALTIRATLPHLIERGTGHYLITSSVAGRRALPGSLYSSTKFAASAMAESLRQELRAREDGNSIRVTSIEPGMVDTPFFDERPGSWALRDADVAEAVEWALGRPDSVDVNEILLRPVGQAV